MSGFFAYLWRMKLIDRWALMRRTENENVQEHSLQVAMIAHALAVIRNRKFPEIGVVNPEKIALYAIYHDASEVITGDLPTPVKYFNAEIKTAYKNIESIAAQKLLQLLPSDLRDDYREIFDESRQDRQHKQIVKSADTICAFIKCLQESHQGNHEFNHARQALLKKIVTYDLPEVDYFMKHFIPSFSESLDHLSKELDENLDDKFEHPHH